MIEIIFTLVFFAILAAVVGLLIADFLDEVRRK